MKALSVVFLTMSNFHWVANLHPNRGQYQIFAHDLNIPNGGWVQWVTLSWRIDSISTLAFWLKLHRSQLNWIAITFKLLSWSFSSVWEWLDCLPTPSPHPFPVLSFSSDILPDFCLFWGIKAHSYFLLFVTLLHTGWPICLTRYVCSSLHPCRHPAVYHLGGYIKNST